MKEWSFKVGRAKYRPFQSTIKDLGRIFTCRLQFWDNIAEILPYMNFQGNRN